MITRLTRSVLRRLGLELRRVNNAPEYLVNIDPAERRAIDDAIDQFTATQPPGSPFADPSEWRQYLPDRRLTLFHEVLRVCDEHEIDLADRAVADIGCGTGYLLRLVGKHSPTAELHGFDTLVDVHPLAQRICPTAQFHDNGFDSITGEFDLIFCTEVVEHLVAPGDALQQMMAVLRYGGVMVITVPNGRDDQLAAGELREDGTSYWGHVNFWSPESWPLFVNRTLPSASKTVFGLTATGENYALIWK